MVSYWIQSVISRKFTCALCSCKKNYTYSFFIELVPGYIKSTDLRVLVAGQLLGQCAIYLGYSEYVYCTNRKYVGDTAFCKHLNEPASADDIGTSAL